MKITMLNIMSLQSTRTCQAKVLHAHTNTEPGTYKLQICNCFTTYWGEALLHSKFLDIMGTCLKVTSTSGKNVLRRTSGQWDGGRDPSKIMHGWLYLDLSLAHKILAPCKTKVWSRASKSVVTYQIWEWLMQSIRFDLRYPIIST